MGRGTRLAASADAARGHTCGGTSVGPELDRYRREVCNAAGHAHGADGELACILETIRRLKEYEAKRG